MKISAIQDVTISEHTEHGLLEIGFRATDEPGTEELLMESIGKFIADNPLVTGFAAAWAYGKVKKYMDSRKNTTAIVARNARDKKMFQKIVNDLLDTGHYRMVKNMYSDGGYMWVLKLKQQPTTPTGKHAH